MSSQIPAWDSFPNMHTYKPKDLAKEAQLKILHELKDAINGHKPSFRHQQTSSFDNGKATKEFMQVKICNFCKKSLVSAKPTCKELKQREVIY